MSQFREAVAATAAGTPYTVGPNKHGFDVRLDTANARIFPARASGITYGVSKANKTSPRITAACDAGAPLNGTC